MGLKIDDSDFESKVQSLDDNSRKKANSHRDDIYGSKSWSWISSN